MLMKLMWCILLVSVYVGGGSAHLVEAMVGRSGGNRVTLCLGAGDSAWTEPAWCAGALLRNQWVLARASCLMNWPLDKVFVLRDSNRLACDEVNNDTKPALTRKLLVRFTHPSPEADLALLAVDRRYWNVPLDDLHVNSTSDQRQLKQCAPWMDDVFHKYTLALDSRPRLYEHSSWLLKTPLRVFLSTMVAPTVACALLFVVALSCVGGGGGDLPYEVLEEDLRDLPSGDLPPEEFGDSKDTEDTEDTPSTDTWPILCNL